MAKVNLVFLVLLPFLLIRPSRFRMKYGWFLLAAVGLVLFVFEVGGWNVLAYSHFTRALEGANPAEQIRYILSAPLQFIRIIANDIWTNTLAYMQGWVGVYGYNYFPVPALTYLLYPLAVLAALALSFGASSSAVSAPSTPAEGPSHPEQQMRADFIDSQPRHIEQQPWTRAVLISLFVIGYLLTIVSLYVAFTPVKSQFVAGVQGRYFTPVMPLLLLALAGIVRGGDAAPIPGSPTSAFPRLSPSHLPSSPSSSTWAGWCSPIMCPAARSTTVLASAISPNIRTGLLKRSLPRPSRPP